MRRINFYNPKKKKERKQNKENKAKEQKKNKKKKQKKQKNKKNKKTKKVSTCAQDHTLNSTFSTTNPLVTANGVCDTGYSGSPTRYCYSNGTWANVVNPCSSKLFLLFSILIFSSTTKRQQNAVYACGYEDILGSTWEQTNAFVTANGTCDTGFSGSPTRYCYPNGTWGDIINPCTCMSFLSFFLSFLLFLLFFFFFFCFFVFFVFN